MTGLFDLGNLPRVVPRGSAPLFTLQEVGTTLIPALGISLLLRWWLGTSLLVFILTITFITLGTHGYNTTEIKYQQPPIDLPGIPKQ